MGRRIRMLTLSCPQEDHQLTCQQTLKCPSCKKSRKRSADRAQSAIATLVASVENAESAEIAENVESVVATVMTREVVAAVTSHLVATAEIAEAVVAARDHPLTSDKIKTDIVVAAPAHVNAPAKTMILICPGDTDPRYPTCSLSCSRRWTATLYRGLSRRSSPKASRQKSCSCTLASPRIRSFSGRLPKVCMPLSSLTFAVKTRARFLCKCLTAPEALTMSASTSTQIWTLSLLPRSRYAPRHLTWLPTTTISILPNTLLLLPNSSTDIHSLHTAPSLRQRHTRLSNLPNSLLNRQPEPTLPSWQA